MEKKSAKIKAALTPRTMGVFVLLIIVLSFVAGIIRGEMVLTLTGAVFLAIWVYCLAMTLLLALFHRRRAGGVTIRLSPEKITSGGWTQVSYFEDEGSSPFREIIQLPGILVRCCVPLFTKDGRHLTYDFKPELKTGAARQEQFQTEKRGAYFSPYDEFAVFDILGFFRFAYRMPVESAARLLVSPHTASETVPVRASGGESCREGLPVDRTDDLVDSRPYVPGDDPRRINWKLYSHGGELFIRQGEREPPPQSAITILIDTQFDALYSRGIFALRNRDKHAVASADARTAVDLLCENAMAIVDGLGKEKDVQIGYTDSGEKNGVSLTRAELGFMLAFPAASPAPMDLPSVPEERAVLILALPRVTSEASSLDRFLSNNASRSIELIFIYGAGEGGNRVHEERAAAAEICVTLYNKRPGVRARAIGFQL